MTTFDPVQYKKIERETYSMTAQANDKYGSAGFEAYAKPMLEGVMLKAGQRVLDVACGTGIPSLIAAPLVMPGGTVTGVDLAPGMVELARKKAEQKGIKNVEFKEADGESLPFPDGSFDVVLCNHGLEHMTDKQKTISEIRRVLKKGGLAGFTVWSTPDKTIPLGIIAKTIMQLWPAAIVPGSPNWFEFGPEGAIEKLLSDNEFKDIRTSRFNIPMKVTSGEEYLGGVIGVSGRLQMLLKNVPADVAENMKKAIIKGAENFRTGNLIRMPCEEVVAIAKA